MTKITINKNQSGMVAISLKGHAQYGEKEDIVCASISTLAGILAKVTELLPTAKAEISPGNCIFYLPQSDYLKAIISIFEDLAEKYPENVKIFF